MSRNYVYLRLRRKQARVLQQALNKVLTFKHFLDSQRQVRELESLKSAVVQSLLDGDKKSLDKPDLMSLESEKVEQDATTD